MGGCYYIRTYKSHWSYKPYMNEKILPALLGGKARSRVVKLFLHHPNLAIGAKDISKRIGAKQGECVRIIKEFSRAGFLLAVKRSNVCKRESSGKSKNAKIVKK